MGKKLNLRGQTFGCVKVLYPTQERYNRSVIWQCECVCGKNVKIPANRLTRGRTQSCNCKGMIKKPKPVRVKKEGSKARLQQFWIWGHNCAVLGYNAEQTQSILTFFQFNRTGPVKAELKSFEEGFLKRPFEWTSKNMPFVTVRPNIGPERRSL